jgi:hypothetical protein
MWGLSRMRRWTYKCFRVDFHNFYDDKIHYDEPRTLKETIRKAKYMYEQGKDRESFVEILEG